MVSLTNHLSPMTCADSRSELRMKKKLNLEEKLADPSWLQIKVITTLRNTISEAANTQIIVKALLSSSVWISDKVLLGSQGGQVFGLGGNLTATTPTEH